MRMTTMMKVTYFMCCVTSVNSLLCFCVYRLKNYILTHLGFTKNLTCTVRLSVCVNFVCFLLFSFLVCMFSVILATS